MVTSGDLVTENPVNIINVRILEVQTIVRLVSECK